MIFVYPILYFGYKIIRKTEIRKPEEIDLFKDLDEIEEYQRNYIPTPPRYALVIFVVIILANTQRLETDSRKSSKNSLADSKARQFLIEDKRLVGDELSVLSFVNIRIYCR